jgi:hypothetical protein
VEECGPCEFYPGICLKTEEKARKNLSQGKKNRSQGRETSVWVLQLSVTEETCSSKTRVNLESLRLVRKSIKTFSNYHNVIKNIRPHKWRVGVKNTLATKQKTVISRCNKDVMISLRGRNMSQAML